MALSDVKILQSERNAAYVKSNPGRRLNGTVEQNKDAFDKFPQLNMDKHNALVDLLITLGLDSIADDIASRYTKTETDAKISEETNDLIESIGFTKADGKFQITTKGGTVTTIDTDLEKIPASFELLEIDGSTYLRITNQDGTYTQTDVTSLLNVYTFNNSDTIAVTEDPKYSVSISVKPNSITLDHLSLAAVSTLEGYVSSAAGSATAAAGSATAAETSANNASKFEQSAKGYSESADASKNAAAGSATSAANAATTANQRANSADASALLAQSYAKGGTGTRPGEDADNAKYYMEQARQIVDSNVTVSTITIPAGRMRGDVNGDGLITIIDKNILEKYTNSAATLDSISLWCADVNNDGVADPSDTLQLIRIIAGNTNALTGIPTFSDYYGNWTYQKIDDLTGEWYTDIPISGMTTSCSASILVQGEFDSGLFTKAECIADALRIYAKLCPISSAKAIVTWSSGDGTAVITTESVEVDEVFVVRITSQTTNGNTVYSADKTALEIMEANNAGKICIAKYNTAILYLVLATTTSVRFAKTDNQDSMLFQIDSSGGALRKMYSLLPQTTTDDNGKTAKVVNGVWTAVADVVLTGTLAVGATSITLQNSAITSDSTIDVYTDKFGISPSNVVVETGKITLTFDAQSESLGVKVEVK